MRFPLQYGQRLILVARRDHNFVKDCVHGLRGCGVDGAIDGDDAAERADRVAFVGQLIRLCDRGSAGQAAGVVMLYYRHRRLREVRHRPPGSVGIHQVVVRQLAPVQLGGSGNPGGSNARRGVQGARLVWVLSVAQAGNLVQRNGQALR